MADAVTLLDNATAANALVFRMTGVDDVAEIPAANIVAYNSDGDYVANEVALTDAEPFYCPTNVAVETLNYTRTFNSTKWQALYVPFAMKYEDWADKAKVAYINDVHQFDDDDDGVVDRTMIEFISVKSGSIKPNMPYLIKPLETGELTLACHNTVLSATETGYVDCSSTSYIYTVTGTYQPKDDMYENGLYAMSDGDFMQAGHSGVTLAPFRIYLDIQSRHGNGTMNRIRKVQVTVDGELETGIDGIVMHDNDDALYDLQGRRVSVSSHGMYICNGKKFIIQ